MDALPVITKYASIINRCSNRFFDQELSCYSIGCGQQFFLMRIHGNEGISMYDLACLGHFDKGTVSKAVQKLEDEGLVQIRTDNADKRIRRVYTTPDALPIIEGTRQLLLGWNAKLTEGLTQQEIEQAERLLSHMANNAYHYLQKKGD